MKIKSHAIFYVVMMLLMLCGLTGCGDNGESSSISPSSSQQVTSSFMFVSYFDDGQMLAKTRYTTEDFSLLVLEEREGYYFDGWYLDEELTNKFDESKLNEYFQMKNISVYASWKLLGNNYQVELKGLIDTKTVINPGFTWQNPYEDSGFSVKILKGDEVVVEEQISTQYYVCPLLDYNTSYKFVVMGNDSSNVNEVAFTTIENNSYKVDEKVVLNDPFMDNMVIQRNKTIDISGVGPQNVLIAVEFGSEVHFGISGTDGKFNVEIPAHQASFDAIEITVGLGLAKSKTIKNVLIGDVFFFSGQSNMQWPVNSSDYDNSLVQNAKKNDVRFFSQSVVKSDKPLDHVTNGKWFSVNSTNYQQYSAIALMSGAFLSEYLAAANVPLGILTAYQGDTNIANWMSEEYYTGTVSTKHLHYNAMVHPLAHVKVSGVVWYQGCNNSAAGGDYKDLLLKYFENYRDLFNDETLPFYVIGLACYDGDSGNNYDFSFVRESQAMACDSDDNAYYISTCDDGDPTFIHPTAKRYIAQRISKSILSTVYGYDYLAEGPSYKSHTVEGNKVIIELNNSKGLYSKGEITNLYLAGPDGKYYLATAKIDNGKIVASSDKVSNPVYIKYGFGKSPFTNVFNKDNFSMVPFRTDSYNLNIDLLEYNNLDAYTFHSSGSKMTIDYVDNGLKIQKKNDGITYGSVILNKWGMVSYNASAFKMTITGTNSGAKITFRVVEGSYEGWGYSIVDNFTGTKTFEVPISEFKCILNKGDNKFNTQAVAYVEFMVETSGAAEFIVNEVKFIEMEETKPTDFTIDAITFNGNNATVMLNKSLFADQYTVLVSSKKDDYSNPVYIETSESTNFTFDISKLTKGAPYYIRAIAKNELGETICTNDSYLFYVKSDDSLIISNFDYETQAELDAFVQTNMKVHAGLDCVLQDHSLKIVSNGQGWQNFIFVIDTGANAGMNKLVFEADFSNYKGTVVLQIVDPSWNTYSYTLDTSTQKSGTFTVNLSDYVLNGSSKKYNNEKLMWVSFNFNDNVGNGYILFDDCQLVK